jgi:hypothetical protein
MILNITAYADVVNIRQITLTQRILQILIGRIRRKIIFLILHPPFLPPESSYVRTGHKHRKLN